MYLRLIKSLIRIKNKNLIDIGYHLDFILNKYGVSTINTKIKLLKLSDFLLIYSSRKSMVLIAL